MCGITGIINKNKDIPISSALSKKSNLYFQALKRQ